MQAIGPAGLHQSAIGVGYQTQTRALPTAAASPFRGPSPSASRNSRTPSPAAPPLAIAALSASQAIDSKLLPQSQSHARSQSPFPSPSPRSLTVTLEALRDAFVPISRRLNLSKQTQQLALGLVHSMLGVTEAMTAPELPRPSVAVAKTRSRANGAQDKEKEKEKERDGKEEKDKDKQMQAESEPDLCHDPAHDVVRLGSGWLLIF